MEVVVLAYLSWQAISRYNHFSAFGWSSHKEKNTPPLERNRFVMRRQRIFSFNVKLRVHTVGFYGSPAKVVGKNKLYFYLISLTKQPQ